VARAFCRTSGFEDTVGGQRMRVRFAGVGLKSLMETSGMRTADGGGGGGGDIVYDGSGRVKMVCRNLKFFLIHGCFEGDIVGVSKSSPRKKFNTPPSFDKVLSVAPGTSYISQH